MKRINYLLVSNDLILLRFSCLTIFNYSTTMFIESFNTSMIKSLLHCREKCAKCLLIQKKILSHIVRKTN